MRRWRTSGGAPDRADKGKLPLALRRRELQPLVGRRYHHLSPATADGGDQGVFVVRRGGAVEEHVDADRRDVGGIEGSDQLRQQQPVDRQPRRVAVQRLLADADHGDARMLGRPLVREQRGAHIRHRVLEPQQARCIAWHQVGQQQRRQRGDDPGQQHRSRIQRRPAARLEVGLGRHPPNPAAGVFAGARARVAPPVGPGRKRARGLARRRAVRINPMATARRRLAHLYAARRREVKGARQRQGSGACETRHKVDHLRHGNMGAAASGRHAGCSCMAGECVASLTLPPPASPAGGPDPRSHSTARASPPA